MSIREAILARRAQKTTSSGGQNPPQELGVGELYLLVRLNSLPVSQSP